MKNRSRIKQQELSRRSYSYKQLNHRSSSTPTSTEEEETKPQTSWTKEDLQHCRRPHQPLGAGTEILTMNRHGQATPTSSTSTTCRRGGQTVPAAPPPRPPSQLHRRAPNLPGPDLHLQKTPPLASTAGQRSPEGTESRTTIKSRRRTPAAPPLATTAGQGSQRHKPPAATPVQGP